MSPRHVTSTMAKLHERQVWLPVANLCVSGLLIENGERILPRARDTSAMAPTG